MQLILTEGHPEVKDKTMIPLLEGDVVEIGRKYTWGRGWGAMYTADVAVFRSGNKVASGYASYMGHPSPFIEVEPDDGGKNIRLYDGRRHSMRNGRLNDGTVPKEFLWKFEEEFRKGVDEINELRKTIGLPRITVSEGCRSDGKVPLTMFCEVGGTAEPRELLGIRVMHEREVALVQALDALNRRRAARGRQPYTWLSFIGTYPNKWWQEDPAILLRDPEWHSRREWVTLKKLEGMEC